MAIMKKYETLKELLDAVRSGEIDESKLEIVMDNDKSSIHFGPVFENEDFDIENEIYTGHGYYDVEDLWPLLFPKAKVGWC